MARKKWDKAPKFDYTGLNANWELDLSKYIKIRIYWSMVPKTIRDIANGLISSWDYYLDGLVLKKKSMTDNQPYAWVKPLK